jgi:hypothetical protein
VGHARIAREWISFIKKVHSCGGKNDKTVVTYKWYPKVAVEAHTWGSIKSLF